MTYLIPPSEHKGSQPHHNPGRGPVARTKTPPSYLPSIGCGEAVHEHGSRDFSDAAIDVLRYSPDGR